nr:hypothetical protein MarFTME_442 [Marseillevirus futianmevirus]
MAEPSTFIHDSIVERIKENAFPSVDLKYSYCFQSFYFSHVLFVSSPSLFGELKYEWQEFGDMTIFACERVSPLDVATKIFDKLSLILKRDLA